jgi:hypothetical protein
MGRNNHQPTWVVFLKQGTKLQSKRTKCPSKSFASTTTMGHSNQGHNNHQPPWVVFMKQETKLQSKRTKCTSKSFASHNDNQRQQPTATATMLSSGVTPHGIHNQQASRHTLLCIGKAYTGIQNRTSKYSSESSMKPWNHSSFQQSKHLASSKAIQGNLAIAWQEEIKNPHHMSWKQSSNRKHCSKTSPLTSLPLMQSVLSHECPLHTILHCHLTTTTSGIMTIQIDKPMYYGTIANLLDQGMLGCTQV